MDYSPYDLRRKNLFKRCQQCAPVITATCPACKADEVCTLTAAECDKCPHYECQKALDSGQIDSKAGGSHKSSAPAIAGGVIGGIILIAALVYIIWKFVLKGRRRDPVPDWDPMDYPMEKPGDDMSTIPRDARSRASTHTVTSMASTVLTRASNIIQIAYIPGVTNRQANQTSPGVLVPPVPPIPIPTAGSNAPSLHEEQHFFLPGDLRDSTFSNATSLDGMGMRQSIAPSLARSSIASTVFRDNAVPTSVTKLKPSLVSVKSNSVASSPAVSTPPIPTVDMRKYQNGGTAIRPMLIKIPSSSDGPKASPVGSLSGMKPTALTITKKKSAGEAGSINSSIAENRAGEQRAVGLGLRTANVISIADSQTSVESPHARARHHLNEESSDDDEEADKHARSRRSLLGKSQSPFSDDAAEDMSEESKKAAKAKEAKGKSPFEDENAL